MIHRADTPGRGLPSRHFQGALRQAAAREPASALDADLRADLAQRFGFSFANVRVHRGTASVALAASLEARAYTIGDSIHLGAEAAGLSTGERRGLLAHEAIHTLQQSDAACTTAPVISRPSDAAELEAAHLAASLRSSRSLALRDRIRAKVAPTTVRRIGTQLVQRDLKGKYPVKDGEFSLGLKTESHPGAKSGMSGTIKFKASDKAPDGDPIRILQEVRNEDLTTGKEYVWTGLDADRNKFMTKGTKDVTAGFQVDVYQPGTKAPRVKGDPAVSPYYTDWVGASPSNVDGSKKGKAIKEASIWDYPGSAGKRRFSFETAAKAPKSGYVYATITWGFTLSDPAKGTVAKEHASAHRGPSATFGAALHAFDIYYKNPGTPGAP